MRQRKLVDFEVHFIWCLRFQFIPYYLKKVTFFSDTVAFVISVLSVANMCFCCCQVISGTACEVCTLGFLAHQWFREGYGPSSDKNP